LSFVSTNGKRNVGERVSRGAFGRGEAVKSEEDIGACAIVIMKLDGDGINTINENAGELSGVKPEGLVGGGVICIIDVGA
jgi:hypothetical protein